MKIKLLLAFTLTMALSQASPTQAKIKTPNNQLPEDRLVLMEQRQSELEKKLAEKNEKQMDVSAGKDGFSISSPDKKFKLAIKGILQADGRFFVGVPKAYGTNTFLLRVARPIIDATFFEKYSVRLAPDFANNSAVIQDAYINAKIMPELEIRVGKFKPAVGLERLQSETNNLFAERSLVSSLTPNRDVGAQISGNILGGVLQYGVGVFNGVADGASNDLDINNSKDVNARVFVKPFAKSEIAALKGLGFGVGGSYGKSQGSTSNTLTAQYKTPAQQTFFRYLSDGTAAGTVLANESNYRLTPQLYYTWGPFTLEGEMMWSVHNVKRDAALAKLTHKAWQVTSGILLTPGDKASFDGVKPKKPFSWKNKQWGAVELVGRYHELRLDTGSFPTFASSTASANRARAFGAGVNWYLNDNLRMVVDYDHTVFTGGAAGGNRPSEKAITTRLQASF